MLRRSAILVVAGILAFLIIACSVPVLKDLPIPFLNQSSPQEMTDANSETPTSTAIVIVNTPQAAPITVTVQSTITPTPSIALSGIEEEETPIIPEEADELDAPASFGFMLPSEANPTATATVIVLFNTPTSQITVNPTQMIQLTPAIRVEPTKQPLPTVVIEPVPALPIPTPTALPLLPEPTETAPAQRKRMENTPEVIWVEDLPGFSRSRVMGWRDGSSYSLFENNGYLARIEEFSVSPDGVWLAYTTMNSPNIWQVNTITGEQRRISPQYAWGPLRFPSWSPNGQKLAFIVEDVPWAFPAGATLWTSSPDGTNLKPVTRQLGWVNWQILLGGWMPNGNDLIYAIFEIPGPPFHQWLTMRVDTGQSQYLPFKGFLYDVSPDSSWLLGDGYTKVRPERRQEYSYNVLMRIPINGDTPQVLTPACRSDILGQISPDGTRIAFLSMPSIGSSCPRLSGPVTYELWVMNSDGSERRQIEIEGIIGQNSPQWSSDGMYIYYSAWVQQRTALWKVDQSGNSSPVELVQTEGVNRFTVVY